MEVGAFGNIVFEVSETRVRTWQKLKRQGAARFATHDVSAGKPRLEFIGPGLESVSLAIRLSAQLGLVPEDELVALREIRDQGKEKTLVMGGQNFGSYVLEDLSEDWLRNGKGGWLLLAEVTLQLKEYVSGI